LTASGKTITDRATARISEVNETKVATLRQKCSVEVFCEPLRHSKQFHEPEQRNCDRKPARADGIASMRR